MANANCHSGTRSRVVCTSKSVKRKSAPMSAVFANVRASLPRGLATSAVIAARTYSAAAMKRTPASSHQADAPKRVTGSSIVRAPFALWIVARMVARPSLAARSTARLNAAPRDSPRMGASA